MHFTRLLRSEYKGKLPENAMTSRYLCNPFTLNQGSPIRIPSLFASSLREITQPSLLDSTTIGLPSRSGRNTRSHETKKLLQSTSAIHCSTRPLRKRTTQSPPLCSYPLPDQNHIACLAVLSPKYCNYIQYIYFLSIHRARHDFQKQTWYGVINPTA